MIQLTDLLAVTRAGSVDWDRVVDLALRRRAAPYLLAALSLASRVLRAPVPDRVPPRLAAATRPGLRRYVEGLDLAYLLRRSQQRPLAGQSDRIRRGLGERAEAARWARRWRDRWRVWHTALRVTRTDTVRHWLGRGAAGTATPPA